MVRGSESGEQGEVGSGSELKLETPPELELESQEDIGLATTGGRLTVDVGVSACAAASGRLLLGTRSERSSLVRAEPYALYKLASCGVPSGSTSSRAYRAQPYEGLHAEPCMR